MHEARWWHRLGPPILALALAAAPLGTPAPAAAAYQGSVYSNITAFDVCSGPNSNPEKMRKAALAAFTTLGYASTSFTRTAFTKTSFLNRTPADWAVYVHSHGDFYNAIGGKPGFRVDGGSCTQPIVGSADIAARRTSGQQTNLVVMSMCHLGEDIAKNDMPLAYAIEKIKASGDSWRGPEFYLGYPGLQWDSDEYQFETLFWNKLVAGSTVGVAFDYALTNGAYFSGFAANWWGSYNYYGLPGPYSSCSRCV